jgi:hypothetical protein
MSRPTAPARHTTTAPRPNAVLMLLSCRLQHGSSGGTRPTGIRGNTTAAAVRRSDLPRPPLALPSPMLTDEEADTIRRKLAEGWRGPVLLTWLEQLLQDREERRLREREKERDPDQLHQP